MEKLSRALRLLGGLCGGRREIAARDMQAFETGYAFNPFRQALECDRFRLPSVARRPDFQLPKLPGTRLENWR